MVQRVLAEYHIILFFGDLHVRRHVNVSML